MEADGGRLEVVRAVMAEAVKAVRMTRMMMAVVVKAVRNRGWW